MNNYEKITESPEALKEFIIAIVNGDCGICPVCEQCSGDCDAGIKEYLEGGNDD